MTTRSFNPLLGQGYNSERQSLAGECVTGDVVLEGRPEASISYSTSISEQQLASELGFEVGAKARLGLLAASASTNFYNASKSDEFSISAIYTGSYFFKNRVLRHPKVLRDIRNAERWREGCGDEFVVQQTLGAKLFFSIRIDFLNEQEKNSFAARFSFDAPFASASAEVERATTSLSKRTKVTINVLQLGGHVDRVTEIFGNKDQSAYQVVQCSSGQFEHCKAVLEKAVEYATNTRTGFPAQIKASAAILSSTTQDYRAADIHIEMTPELSQQIKLVRKRLSEKYDEVYTQYMQVRRLVRESVVRVSSRQRTHFLRMENSLFDSLREITEASLLCFNSPRDCSSAYADIRDVTYLEKDFKVDFETFAQYCDLGQSPQSSKPLASTIAALVQSARKLDPISLNSDDVCYAAEQVLMRQASLSIWSDKTLDLRPFSVFTNLKYLELKNSQTADLSPLSSLSLDRLDMRYVHLHARCPFANAAKCIRADFRDKIFSSPIPRTVSVPRISHAAVLLNGGDIFISGGQFIDKGPSDELYTAGNGKFALNHAQSFSRYYHTATRLLSGDVLLVGGYGALQSAELFLDSSRSFFGLSHQPLVNRAHHTATLLPDGRVLLAGGWSGPAGVIVGNDQTPSAEIFDPAAGRFMQVAPMSLARAGHRATLLPGNRVLISGGFGITGLLSSAEIYDVAHNRWSLVGPMSHKRAEHTATTLRDGRVLIAGGYNDQAEFFDPGTERFSHLLTLMTEARGEHQAALLSDGRVAIFGGRRDATVQVGWDDEKVPGVSKTIEIFDPASGIFTRSEQNMAVPRAEFSATFIGNDKILVMGGLGGLAAYSAELLHYFSETKTRKPTTDDKPGALLLR
ncbi:MAG: kelch repeat-containing protein [Myxococcota bacterium]